MRLVACSFQLRAYLDCDGVSIERCADIKGEHDWMQFRAAPKLYAIILAYLAGWGDGGRDALDAHYGRPSEAERIETFKRENPDHA